jgi:hypothetical protein
MENRSQNSPRPDPIGLGRGELPLNESPHQLDPDLANNALATPALDTLAQTVQGLAQQATGSSTQLLALLRVLESLHREICEGSFQQSLPNTRQNLHFLLRDIESQGGWPYIPRLKLQRLLTALEGPAETATVAEPDDQPDASA